MILSKETLDIDGLHGKIKVKNPEIARSTVRGRLSEMVKAGEVKKIGETFVTVTEKKQAEEQILVAN